MKYLSTACRIITVTGSPRPVSDSVQTHRRLLEVVLRGKVAAAVADSFEEPPSLERVRSRVCPSIIQNGQLAAERFKLRLLNLLAGGHRGLGCQTFSVLQKRKLRTAVNRQSSGLGAGRTTLQAKVLPNYVHLPVLTRMRGGSPRDARPHAVAEIVGVLRQAHGDAGARLMLDVGMTLETLIDALLRAPLSHCDAVRLMTSALEAGDFDVTPDFTTLPSHLKFVYEPPGSLQVVDIMILTEQRAFSSTEIRLRLRMDA